MRDSPTDGSMVPVESNRFETICRNYFNIRILKISSFFKIPYGFSLDFLGQPLLE